MALLRIVKGPSHIQEVPLTADRVTFGRDPGCAVVIPIMSVSRVHAQLVKVQGQWFLEDLHSRNGTFLNNTAVTASTPLKDNDKIRIGDFLAVFSDSPAQGDHFDVGESDIAGAAYFLRPPGGEDRPGIHLLRGRGVPLDDECRRIRGALGINHVFYDRADSNGLHQQMEVPDSAARRILGEGFHRLVVFDAARGLSPATGRFELGRFLRHAHEQLVESFDLPREGAFHAEDIAQILKDEPRSLFCFLNLQHVPVADLHRLRNFTQELHQALLLCRGPRDLVHEEAAVPVPDSSLLDATVQADEPPGRSGSALRMTELLSKTFDFELLLPRIPDVLFELFPNAEGCSVVLRPRGSEDLRLRAMKYRGGAGLGGSSFSEDLVRQCLAAGEGVIGDGAGSMCVPLVASEDRAFGAVQLDARDRGRKFTRADLALLTNVARQVSLALENARLHADLLSKERLQRDLDLANQVQRSFLPRRLPEVPGYEFFAHSEVAGQLSGDYHDFVRLKDGRLAVLVCDVAGRSVPAALVMANVRAAARFSLTQATDPAAAITTLNNYLHADLSESDRFCTLALAVLDPDQHALTMVSAGHESPLVFRAATKALGQAMGQGEAGLPLGMMKGFEYASSEVALGLGDCLLLLTDGIPDATSPREEAFGRRGLETALRSDALGDARSPRRLGEFLVKAVREHTAGRSLYDDWTLVCLGRTDAG